MTLQKSPFNYFAYELHVEYLLIPCITRRDPITISLTTSWLMVIFVMFLDNCFSKECSIPKITEDSQFNPLPDELKNASESSFP